MCNGFCLCSLSAWTFVLEQHKGGLEDSFAHYLLTVWGRSSQQNPHQFYTTGLFYFFFFGGHCYSGARFVRAPRSWDGESKDRWAYTNVLVFPLNTPSLFLTNFSVSGRSVLSKLLLPVREAHSVKFKKKNHCVHCGTEIKICDWSIERQIFLIPLWEEWSMIQVMTPKCGRGWSRISGRRQLWAGLLATPQCASTLHTEHRAAGAAGPLHPLIINATAWKMSCGVTKITLGPYLQLCLKNADCKHRWRNELLSAMGYFSYCSTWCPFPLITPAGLIHPADVQ